MEIKQKLEEILKGLPSAWKNDLITALCEISKDSELECSKVKDCETLTSLSNFTVEGNTVSIVYKDEDGVSVTRNFSIEQILNYNLEDLDPLCLADPEDWQSLSYKDKIQELIIQHCDCCSTSTTTTTTTP